MTLWRALPQARLEDAPTLAGGFLGLLNGLISPATDDLQEPGLERGMLPSMKHYLDSRLSDPGLGVEDLVQAFHCSRSTVYRLFRETGGVGAYIRDQRLTRCFRELTQRATCRPRVHQVALKRGFQDSHHFSCLFKKRFGLTPTEAAKGTEPSSAELDVPTSPSFRERLELFHRWLTHR
jgi:AraC-like DNA-binding protein